MNLVCKRGIESGGVHHWLGTHIGAGETNFYTRKDSEVTGNRIGSQFGSGWGLQQTKAPIILIQGIQYHINVQPTAQSGISSVAFYRDSIILHWWITASKHLDTIL